MNENIALFLKKFAEQPDLQEKMKSITDPDEAYALASSLQGGFTKDEFIAAMLQFKQAVDDAELTDADLAQTAGGISETAKEVIGLSLVGIAVGIPTGMVAAAAA